MPSRKISLSTHSYSRFSSAVTLDVTSTTLADERQFKFEDITGYSEFTSLYDSYKLTKVVMMIQLITNPDSISPLNTLNTTGAFNPSNFYPRWWYVRDYDGGTDTLATIKERSGVKCFLLRPNKINRIVIKPRVLVQAYAGVSSTGYLVKQSKSLFIDMANTSVPHYGLSSVVDTMGQDPSDSYPFKIRVEFKYYFTCKDVR